MQIQLETGDNLNLIRAHAPGQVTVNETVYRASVIVLPNRVIADWPPQQFADLAAPHLQVLGELESEVVLIGTGRRLQFPRAELLAPLIATGTGFEIMDTAAACRTYNILMGEGRKVAAALMMIEVD
jgi:uncharacterized protein